MLIDPVLPTPIRFADVAAQSQALDIEHGLLAVIALVGNEFSPRLHLVLGDCGYRFQLFDRFGQRGLYRGGVALIGSARVGVSIPEAWASLVKNSL